MRLDQSVFMHENLSGFNTTFQACYCSYWSVYNIGYTIDVDEMFDSFSNSQLHNSIV